MFLQLYGGEREGEERGKEIQVVLRVKGQINMRVKVGLRVKRERVEF
jgi:hypothetical protein